MRARRSAASHRGSDSSAKILATLSHRAHLLPNFEQTLRHCGMMQDGLQIAGTRGGRRRDASPPSTHMHPLECVTCQWADYNSPVQDPSFFLARCRLTGIPRELAMSLNRATQPGPASPGGGKQAQRHKPASLSSESGESLRHVTEDATPPLVGGEAG